MSNQSIKHRMHRILACTTILLWAALIPIEIHSQENNGRPAPPPPRLVKARQGDTLALLARRYLKDASKEWMIAEYNGITSVADGQTVLIPAVPFRKGGLTPEGYQSVPVLAFTGVGESASTFKDQMRFLKTDGFRAITPQQLADFMEFSGQLPYRSVLITFDSISRTFYDFGIPVLKDLGFTATLFVATADVGSKGAMTWEQIERLHQDGFTIACRGRSGRSLTVQTKGQSFEDFFQLVESELRQSRKEIEAHLKAPCLFLAYPHGDTNSLVSAMAAKLGFSAAFILSPGDNPYFGDRFGIHRTAIDSQVSPEQFGKMLTTLIAADLN